MHKFLRAVGFSDIKKKDFEIIRDEIIERPDLIKVTRDSEGNEFVELTKNYGENFGIIICGSYDEEDTFHMDYYFPYALSEQISSREPVDIEKHAEKESYAGVCDEMRLGVTLIFYLQNAADFLSEHHGDIHAKTLQGVKLSALSTDGKVLLPMYQRILETQTVNQKQEKRKQLLAEAREGNEEAIESLTLEDMDIYNSISKRIQTEDVLSIVNSTFMPYGIESDQYYILGKILEVKETRNRLSGESIYILEIECNDMVFSVTINKEDLLGEPKVGRRFKGSIWMQGTVFI